MTALVSALDSTLLHFVWQGAAVALVLWMVLAALRKRSANARYVASCAAMAILAAMPVVTAWRAYARSMEVDGATVTIVRFVEPVNAAREGVDWLALAQSWMAPVWACGVLLLSLRMLWGCAKVSRLRREGEAAESAVVAAVDRLAQRLGVTRPVRVLISTLVDGPSVVGWMRPVLLFPAATLLGLSAEQLEAVLAHELAHVRRYDYLVNLMQMLMETLFFYQPAVWWISRRMREERELCCDDIAVLSCGDAMCYARALTALERMRVLQPSFALAAQDGPLMYRIERLLGVARREPAPARLPGMVAMCLVLACLTPGTKAARAQPVPLASAPIPSAAALLATPAPQASPRARYQIVQAPAVEQEPGPVTVEVTVGQDGFVEDARVIDGPLDQRRAALLTALGMSFGHADEGTQRTVRVLSSPNTFRDYAGFKPVLSADDARDNLAKAEAQLAKLRAQQAEASERGAKQLQEAINSLDKTAQTMRRAIEGPSPLEGKPLANVEIYGSDEARARLPMLWQQFT